MQNRSFHFLALALLLSLGVLPASGNNTGDSLFTLKGQLTDINKKTKIRLNYTNRGIPVKDSLYTTDGSFTFKGSIPVPERAWIYIDNDLRQKSANTFNDPYARNFYLEAGVIRITGSGEVSKAVIEGSKTEDESQEWQKMIAPQLERSGKLRTQLYYVRQNPDRKDSIAIVKEEIAAIYKKTGVIKKAFIEQHPASYISWELVKGESYGIDPDVLGPTFAALAPSFKNSKEGKDIANRLAIAKNTWIGAPALPFSQPDVNGKDVRLSSFKGKYVLIDFWASWCGICRMENPNVLRAYNAFKDKGFTVLGVSLDDANQKKAWLDAIKKDGMPWQQVSDLKGRENEVARLYGIKGIPQNVLVDPDGIIVAKNLRDMDLMEKLEEIFSKK